MNLFSVALKFNNFVAGNAVWQSSLLADESGKVQNTFESTSLGSAIFELMVQAISLFFTRFIYLICSFVLNVIEIVQIAVCRILGINVSISDYVVIDSKNPLVRILTDETVLNVFKWILGITFVLIILFTILAIVKSEYEFAIQRRESNSKGRIFLRSLRSFFTVGMFPLILLLGIVITNAVLAGFNDILRNGENTTISAQIFMSSVYEANNYRNYADADNRIPIIVNFEDPQNLGQVSGYSTEELATIYKSFQKTGQKLYNNYFDDQNTSFSDAVVYKNNRIYNQNTYSGFERFVCTREQYYVLADFMDYAVKNNVKYYVKNMTDVDIDWKYVQSSVYDSENHTLSITYNDYSNLNNGKSYRVVYSPNQDRLATPISDAIKTISALLAFGDYEDNTFNILKRLEDSINIVEWETEKALIRLSDEAIEAINNAHSVDQILQALNNNDRLILFERARYSSNNTLNATINDLVDGIELPVQRIDKRFYQKSSGKYVTTEQIYVVSINGTYYEVEKNETLKDLNGNLLHDSYGDAYYTLCQTDFDIDQVFGTNGSFTVRKIDNQGNVQFVKVNDNEVVDFGNVASSKGETYNLGKFAKNEDSFKDVVQNILTGSHQVELENGEVTYAIYDDQIQTVIKQTAWPNKLIKDLQVMYKDININNLIANGSWLEQLSEYVLATGSSSQSAGIQTGLIHPLGLIISEFMLSEIGVSDGALSLGSLEYNSKFDEDTIRALIVSLLGEDRYLQTYEQLKYFHEFFNVYMAPVLDEISFYENFDLVSGQAESVQLYTYRAYLASILLSANASDWLYKSAVQMLGSTDFASVMIKADGSYKKYNELDSYYQALLKQTYNNANAKLEKQYVKPGDKAYPEYLYVLGNYIDGKITINSGDEDYFGGRLDNILTSFLSYDFRAEKVDDAKIDLKKSYAILQSSLTELTKEFKILEPNDNVSLAIFLNTLNSYFKNPSSSYSYKDNDFTLRADGVIFGDQRKDDLDLLTQSFSISELRGKANTNKADEGELITYINQNFEQFVASGLLNNSSRSAFDDFIKEVKKYYSNLIVYLDAKDELLETDNSSSLVGTASGLKRTISNYFDQAKSIYKELAQNAKTRVYISNLIEGVDNQSDFSSKENWEALCANFASKYDSFMQIIDREDSAFSQEEKNMLQMYFESVGCYIRQQKTLDRLNRYEIIFSVQSEMSNDAITSLDIVVNSKHYTVGQNFTKAKFLEYVLGSKVLKQLGYNTVFVSESYEGIVRLEEITLQSAEQKGIDVASLIKMKDANGIEKYYCLSESFKDIHDFAVELGEISAKLYQMSNLANLSKSSLDEILIGYSLNGEQTDLAQRILYMLVAENHIPYDILMSIFGFESKDLLDMDKLTDNESFESLCQRKTLSIITNAGVEKNNEFLNTVLSYLLLTDGDSSKSNFVDYKNFTLKDLRIACLKALIGFEQQEGESTEQNQKRYLALLALGCSDWVTGGGADGSPEFGAIDCSWSASRRKNITNLKVSNQSKAIILRLAGLENRPYEELVDAEYSVDFNINGVDERYGDIFVICTFDEERKLFVPFMMSNKYNASSDNEVHDEEGMTWSDRYEYRNPYTEAYVSGDENDEDIFFPIIAKGIITSDGRPTAIREVDGNIEYYRDSVVIRDVSKIGLEEYFVSTDQIKVHHTALSMITNGISKLFTGKTLIEQLATKIPRYMATTNYNFCYGVDTVVEHTSVDGLVKMSYNFGRENSFTMDKVYDESKLNIVILLIGVVTMFLAIFRALFGAIGRVFDVALDFLIGPLAISTIVLKTDDPDKDKKKREKGITHESENQFDSWKSKIISDVVSVFGYAIGFNIFFIVAPIISNIQLFPDVSAFENLPLFRNLSLGFVNEIGRLLFIIASAYLSTRAPKMLSKLLSSGSVNLEDPFEYGKNVKTSIKNTANQVATTLSGQQLVNDFNDVKSTMKNAIPGVAVYKEVKAGVKKATAKVASKAVEYYAKANGVPPELAKTLGRELDESMTEQAEKEKNS